MRRLLVSVAIIVLVAGATTASATSLVLRPLALSAASAPVGPCDPDGVRVAYHLAWRGHVSIARVDVSGIADRCVGHELTAVLVVAGKPVDLGSVTVRLNRPGDNTASVVVRADLRATAAESLHVSIT
jgi:hypothetical protein